MKIQMFSINRFRVRRLVYLYATGLTSLITCMCLNARTYVYDDQGQLSRVAYPQGGGIAYAYDEAGNMTSMTRLNLPVAPDALAATRSAGSIALTWTDRSNDETEFLLYRRGDNALGGAFWTLIATLAANTTSHTDNDVLAQKTYEYKVAANSGDGPSAESSIVESVDPIPFDLVSSGVIGTSEDRVEVTITIPSVSESVYAVEVSQDMIRWAKSPIANGSTDPGPNQVWANAQGDFLGHFTLPTTTVVIDVAPDSRYRFYRVVRQ